MHMRSRHNLLWACPILVRRSLPILTTMQRTKRARKSPLEDNLLSDEERAVLYELDQSFLIDDDDLGGSNSYSCSQCLNCCRLLCLDKGTISMVVTLVIAAVGIALLVLARELMLPPEVEELSLYFISAGVFGLAGGGTNAIAILMLLFRVPLVCGSGVFYKQHKHIRRVIKMIVLQLLFDSQHLEHYITRKIKQFSSRVRIVDNITQALDSPEVETVIEARLCYLYAQPESYYLEQMGLKKDKVKALIKPSIISLCAETAPYVLDTVADTDSEQVLSVHRFREQMDHYLNWRVEELTEKRVGSLMRKLIYRHLGWLVVWGCLFGVATGIVVQGVKISLNFNFITTSTQ